MRLANQDFTKYVSDKAKRPVIYLQRKVPDELSHGWSLYVSPASRSFSESGLMSDFLDVHISQPELTGTCVRACYFRGELQLYLYVSSLFIPLFVGRQGDRKTAIMAFYGVH